MTIQTDPQYKLRLPAELKHSIEVAAGNNHRSMNAEIVARLTESFIDQPKAPLRLSELVDLLIEAGKARGIPIKVILGEDDADEQDD
ncbi:hypothetical protein SB14R_10480 [Pseudomonas oryzihabitans]|nr:hypothetical protein SB14R_10480 [Pseudomonas psychrotolerans]